MATRALDTITLIANSSALGGFVALDMNNELIPNVADPVSAQDAVNLQTLESYTPFDQVVRAEQIVGAGDIDNLIGNATLGIYIGWVESAFQPQLRLVLASTTVAARMNYINVTYSEDGGARQSIGQTNLPASTPSTDYAYFHIDPASNSLNALNNPGDMQALSVTVRSIAGNFKMTASAQLFEDINNADALSVELEATLKTLV